MKTALRLLLKASNGTSHYTVILITPEIMVVNFNPLGAYLAKNISVKIILVPMVVQIQLTDVLPPTHPRHSLGLLVTNLNINKSSSSLISCHVDLDCLLRYNVYFYLTCLGTEVRLHTMICRADFSHDLFTRRRSVA